MPPRAESITSTQTGSTESDQENGTSGRSSPAVGRAGNVSPSAVCLSRRLSHVIVTTPEKASPKRLIEGRRATVVLPSLDIATSKAATAATERRHRPSYNALPIPRMAKPGFRRYASAPMKVETTRVLTDPPPLRLDAWAEPPASSFCVRGANYLSDCKKGASDGSAFRLLTFDLIKSNKPMLGGICSQPNERIQRALRREQETGVRELPDFVFAVTIAIPGPPCYSMVSYFGVDDMETIKSCDTPFGRIAEKFFFGESDEFRDNTFKLIPRITEGNFVVKKAVGSKPSILGKKLKQIYVRDERFFELIVDIGSDKIAQKIVKLSVGYARTLVVDMAFVLEGKDEATLPEQVMGCIRLKNVDFKKKDGQRTCLTT